MRRRVTLLACQAGVLSFQLVASEPVVELLLRGLPANQIKTLAVVLEVAAHTVPAIGVVHLHLRVITVFVFERFGNLFMAIETFESGSTGAELVTGTTLRRTAQRGVSLREWAGGYLCTGRSSKSEDASGYKRESQNGLPEKLVQVPSLQDGSPLAQVFLRDH